MIKKRWVADNNKLDIVNKLYETEKIDKTLLRILVNRGIEEREQIYKYLNPSLSDLHDPYLLLDMKSAVRRIKRAEENNEIVCVYGDYDVDGVTASAILTRCLRKKLRVINYIPDRRSEGYGLNEGAIDRIKESGVSLIITVDCGISSFCESIYALQNGIDLIITDHHTCQEIVPDCVAVINPKRYEKSYPFDSLCGAGVALKLVMALGEEDLSEYIAICAIGTVADVVPLKDENRIIVHYGLKYLREGKIKAVNALCEASGVDIKKLGVTDLGFMISPRINAAGRMASAKDALTLFLSDNDEEIKKKVEILNEKNILRQETEKDIYNQVKSKIESDSSYKDKEILVVAGNNWHEGVIGIVASRITEEYFKPSVLISMDAGTGKGSSRSIKGFNIYDALNSSKDYLEKFGGHELAAGLTVSKEKFNDFKEYIELYAKKEMEIKRPCAELFIDSKLSVECISEEFFESLKVLEPYGTGNEQPLFLLKDAVVVKSMAFKENKHLKLTLKVDNKIIEGIFFNMGEFQWALKENDILYIAGYAMINEFRERKTLQIRIKDIKRKV